MPIQSTTTQDALKTFDREESGKAMKFAGQERQTLLQLFPLEGWENMSLEQYALGQDDSSKTYCYLIEFGSPNLGSMRGGSSLKHIIYKHKNNPGWYYPSIYPNEKQAWETVRAAFIEAYSLAQQGRWEEIDELEPLSPGRALRVKTLHLYFPNEILPISSTEHLRHFLKRLNTYESVMEQWSSVQLNRELLRVLKAQPEFTSWSTLELARFLYHWADPRETRRIVKIAPGEQARLWKDCLENGYICLGWDEVGDLRVYESEEAFREKFFEIYSDKYKGHKLTLNNKAREVWTMISLEPGDIVIANQGISKILAVGEVVEPGYQYHPEREEYHHTVTVKWDTSYEQDIDPQRRWGLNTVDNVSTTLYQKVISRKTQGKMQVTPKLVADPLFLKIADALERRGQVILYGPPGTGKTFHARRFAVWWLFKDTNEEKAFQAIADSDALKKAENQLKEQRNKQPQVSKDEMGQLTWVTFHPSYSYEDFVEGFRPLEAKEGGLHLHMEDGLFKRICQDAQTHDKQKYLLVIDEINRANLAKVFGELITLLEKDKRGLTIKLPQSKDQFQIPENVFVLGTMNTADRSIKLIDVALRRRFAFIELMPDYETLTGARINDLPLKEFLEALNQRIMKAEGREKQIGHAVLLEGDQPIREPKEFGRRFREEILPLLQEYCYDDYGALSEYLGNEIVNSQTFALDAEILGNDEKLIESLAKLGYESQ